MLHITEDTPADMLSGAMDLTIHLPSGKAVKMCVERSTPMMDLLVHITTKHQLQITNHTLQPLQTAPNDSYPENILSYYPNTPIGALDTQHVKVVPKTRSLLLPKNVPPGHQPFESTFRLKVHLPRNQLYVTRVSRHVHIEDIMQKVCDEKNLDAKKFEVRHPGNLDEILDPKLTLNDYMITEIYLILKGSNSLTQAFSSNDIMTLRKEEERKQMHNKTGGGVFNLIFRRGKTSGSNPTTPTETPIHLQNNEDSRIMPPPATPLEIVPPPKVEMPVEKPKPPQRKRRPAPKPPKPVVEEPPQNEAVEMRVGSSVSDNSTANSDNVPTKSDTVLTICHSRHSSDSSGYHETSILSDHCNTSLPRKSRLEEREPTGKSLNRRSESTGNLTKMVVQSMSTSSLAFPGRKKKTAPPPPTPIHKSTSSSMNLEHPSPVVASQTPSSSSPSRTESISSTGAQPAQNKLDLILENLPEALGNPAEIDNMEIISKLDDIPPLQSCYIDVEKSEVSLEDIGKYIKYEKSPKDSGNSSDISEKSKNDEDTLNVEVLDVNQDMNEEENEEWQLPSPPKAFKDLTPNPQDLLKSETTETDCILTPELLKKLKELEVKSVAQTEHTEHYSDVSSNAEDEERLILSNLSLENLEKRKSLVYNRELATSLKSSYESSENLLNKKYQSDLDLSKSLNNFEKTLEDIRNENTKNIERSASIKASVTQSTLPNFKITTYNEPKQKIKVFEDDTIRSNSEVTKKSYTLDRTQSLQKTYIGRSMENISIRHEEIIFKKPRDIEHRLFSPKNRNSKVSLNRSGSFSSDQNEWSPSKPVARSKSQVAIKRNDSSNRIQSGDLSKSNSLFDVSGLQSLEVMRKIQNKLNTPAASMETLTKTETVESRQEVKPGPVEAQEVPLRKFQYSGPPSVNMGTWSERPKVPVSVKEDSDYKLGRGKNRPHSEIIANIQNVPSKNTVEIRHTTVNKQYNFPAKTEAQNVTIKINGCEPISAQKNNVLIKIGDQNSRFHDFNTPIVYRTPLNTLNRNSQRPHSVAFPSDFDLSRVPVVRSVELKKAFQEGRNNTSVTHLNQPNVNYFSNGFSEKSKYSSSENLTNNNNYVSDNVSKPVYRAKSFLQPAPVVKGFRNFGDSTISNGTTTGSTNKMHSSMTLPSSVKQTYTTNQHVPFSKFNLRRTESKKIVESEQNLEESDTNRVIKISSTPVNTLQLENRNILLSSKTEKVTNDSFAPPAPPQMPKVVHKKISNRQFVPVLDPRDELLKSIRDFGGKKGLRGRKA